MFFASSLLQDASSAKLGSFDVLEITVQQLQHHFSEKHFTSAEFVGFCLERIRQLNPYLEAVIETNPDAFPIAQLLDRERASGKIRGKLHGVPVLVKDNIATKDSMQTTAGSWALLGSIVPKDAFVVARLREEGAVILGHANMSEWASLRSKAYSTGYSPRGGQCRNPYDLSKSPFGSSSGSAVAVSANFVPLSIGTETDTSIIGPAAANGVVGIKSTVGLTSRSSVIPISENMDSVGPFGRTVRDAAIILDAMAAKDPEDPFTMSSRIPRGISFVDCISKKDVLRGARFGLPMRGCWSSAPEDCRPVASEVLEAIKEAGAEVIEVNLPSIDERGTPYGRWDWEHGELSISEWTVAKVDAYNGINDYLQRLVQSPVRSLEEVIEYNKQNAGTEGGVPGVLPAFPDG